MTLFKATLSVAAICLIGTSASAQDNPLLQQNTNPLLQENTAGPTFEQQAREIDMAARLEASNPTCQNIRANYDQAAAKIQKKAGSNAGELSGIRQLAGNSRNTAGRLNSINRNLTGDYSNGLSRGLGDASNKVGRGLNVVNDVQAIGGMFGIKGKSKQEKAAEKMAKLDAQAMDAARQTSCPMATFY